MRLLGNGEINAKLAFEVTGASSSAIKAVEAKGGTVTLKSITGREKPAADKIKADKRAAKRVAKAAAKGGKKAKARGEAAAAEEAQAEAPKAAKASPSPSRRQSAEGQAGQEGQVRVTAWAARCRSPCSPEKRALDGLRRRTARRQSQLRGLRQGDELKKRIWFTLGALLVYRLGTYIPIPGINPQALAADLPAAAGGILGMFNMFSGGAVGRMAIFALNIMPYISASIIIQLLTTVSPHLEAAEEGRRAGPQADQPVHALRARWCWPRSRPTASPSASKAAGNGVVLDPGLFFRITTVITLVGGTMFLMWLGEQITARGVGNGISLIIFAGIVAQLPHRPGRHCSNSAAGRALRPLIIGAAGDGDRRHRRHRLHGAGAAAAAGAISEAPGRQPHVPGRYLASAAEAQHRRA